MRHFIRFFCENPLGCFMLGLCRRKRRHDGFRRLTPMKIRFSRQIPFNATIPRNGHRRAAESDPPVRNHDCPASLLSGILAVRKSLLHERICPEIFVARKDVRSGDRHAFPTVMRAGHAHRSRASKARERRLSPGPARYNVQYSTMPVNPTTIAMTPPIRVDRIYRSDGPVAS